jgi:aryl carrier-like protein
VTHVVARDTQADDLPLVTQLRAHCERSLAPYLVPQSFVLHAALPLTPSGKIDRRQLASAVDEIVFAWPEHASLEQQLTGLWSQLLGLTELAIDANLFDLGARSLTVVHALTELRRRGYRSLTAVQIYEHPSVAKQTALLRAQPTAVPVAAAVAARAENQRAALSRFGPRGGAAR